jgi:uncharacterized membrane protein
MSERGHAMVNGAMIAMGSLAILDNVVVHWLLGLHRAVPGPNALLVEWCLIALGAALVVIGWRRERRARWRLRRPS